MSTRQLLDDAKVVRSSKRLMTACRYGDFSHFSLAISLICDSSADVNYSNGFSTPLNFSLNFHNFHTAKYLLNVPGIDINKSDFYGCTPLHISCYQNNVEIIQLLCRHPSMTSLNTRDVSGNSPIMLAVQLGKVDAVKELLKIRGVDLSTKSVYAETLADIAKYDL